MSTLFPKTISYETQTTTKVEGIYTSNAPVVLTFQGSVQPMSGKEITALNIGREDLGKVKIYSDTPIPVSKENSTQKGALVTWQAQKWETIYELINQNGIIDHYKYIGEYRGTV